MSKIFNWEYFSYVTLDDAVAYKVRKKHCKQVTGWPAVFCVDLHFSPGSVGGARRHIRPIPGLDAAREGTRGGGGQEGRD